MNNRLWNCKNLYQGSHKKVLCICSAGLLRSPTAAHVLSQPPFNFNTRSAGVGQDFALIPMDPVLLEWADYVVCMTKDHVEEIKQMANSELDIHCLEIKDAYEYRNPDLMELLKTKFLEIFKDDIKKDVI